MGAVRSFVLRRETFDQPWKKKRLSRLARLERDTTRAVVGTGSEEA